MKKQVECINRLHDLTGGMDDMIHFLVDEKLMSGDSVKAIKSSATQAKDFRLYLESIREKLQLLEFTWDILPVERIKIIIVTDRANKEFTFNF